jgi:hypothetical protein
MGRVWASKFELTHAGSISCDTWVSRSPVSRMFLKFVHESLVESFVVLVRPVNPC